MYLAGNANLTHEDDARAQSDAVATKSWGSGSVLPKSHAKNGENLDPTGPVFSNRWTRIPGPGSGPKMADTRVKPDPDPVSPFGLLGLGETGQPHLGAGVHSNTFVLLRLELCAKLFHLIFGLRQSLQ